MAGRLAATAHRDDVAEAVKRLIDPDIAVASWRPLAGGRGVRCFVIEVAGRQVVAKLADRVSPTVLGVEAEFRLLEHAAGIGVAPKPFGFDRDSGLLLYEFVDAAAWPPGGFHAASNIAIVAERLRRLHTLPTVVRPYEPRQFARIYADRCVAEGSARAETLARELDACAGFLDDAHDEAVVCHNDLHASNLLRAAGVLFIDFEYAAAAPPIVDLASIIAMNDFDPMQIEQLLGAYYEGRSPPFEREALANAVRVHELLAELWRASRVETSAAALRQQQSTIEKVSRA